MIRRQIKRISSKQLGKLRAWQNLKDYLFIHRAGGKCELCKYDPNNDEHPRNMDGHHIIKKSLMGAWQAWNCLILCRRCHDRQATNTPQQVEALLKFVEKRNKECGIDRKMGWVEK